MNNIIVREKSSEIRAIGRNALKGNWPMAVLGFFIYYLMTATIPAVLTALIPGASMTYYNELVDQNLTLSYVSNLYTAILSGAFSLGLCSFMLAFFRKRDINPGYIFNGFEYFFKSLGMSIVMGFFIFLWSLLLVVPGIIAAIKYSQAFYVLADHPEKGIMECISQSKLLMNGNKSRFFWLGLSFFGWLFAASIPVLWFPAFSGIGGIIMDLVSSIPYMFAMTYLHTARTAFYDLAAGNLMAKQQAFNEEDYNF